MSDNALLDEEKDVDEISVTSTEEQTPEGITPDELPLTESSKAKLNKVSAIQDISKAVKGITQEQLEVVMPKIMAALTENDEVSEVVTETVTPKSLPRVSVEDVDVSEDVTAMFKGESLSEDFTSKATTIFEAAVVSKVNELLETVAIDLESEIEAGKESMVSEMADKLDNYLEYVVEQWMTDNVLAVEQGITSEIQENFMQGLRNLFTENYIDVPEEKVDLVDELVAKVEELQTDVNEELDKNIDLKKELSEAKSAIVLSRVSEGLTESQAIKLTSLSEGVEFENEESFAEKLETIKENYFVEDKPLVEDTDFDNEPLEIKEDAEVQIDPGMASYITAISKSIKK